MTGLTTDAHHQDDDADAVSNPVPGWRVLRAAIWLPGLAVALGAAVATAHGLYEVAIAARVPAAIAWLYPLITDGLALVAYAATTRLTGRARRYAWAVVILAAGLSGLAQASYLAATPDPAGSGADLAYGGAGFTAPALLRFGVGAWPAIAAAIVAHLLYLLAADPEPGRAEGKFAERGRSHGQRGAPFNARSAVQSSAPPVQPALSNRPATPPDPAASVQPAAAVQPARDGMDADRPTPPAAAAEQPPRAPSSTSESPARERARAAAARHADRHGALPTVTRLAELAEVSRGTAATVLKALREHPAPLHLVIDTPKPRTRP